MNSEYGKVKECLMLRNVLFSETNYMILIKSASRVSESVQIELQDIYMDRTKSSKKEIIYM